MKAAMTTMIRAITQIVTAMQTLPMHMNTQQIKKSIAIKTANNKIKPMSDISKFFFISLSFFAPACADIYTRSKVDWKHQADIVDKGWK